MQSIRPCSSCAAPVTLKMTTCPHCNAVNPVGVMARAAGVLAAVAGGLSLSTTLAACYGAPCAEGEDDCPRYTPSCSEVSSDPKKDDVDGDGYCKAQDCNEQNPKINAAAREIRGDGIDQNCDGND
jgi:hypothetical protein